IHAGAFPLLDETRRRWQRQEQRSDSDMSYLVYTLLDSLVDAYMQEQDWLQERVAHVDDVLLDRLDRRILPEINSLRRDLSRLRRVVGPTRDVFNEISRHDLPLFPDSMRPYFTDVYDHILRVLDGLDTYRDLLATSLDIYLSAVA